MPGLIRILLSNGTIAAGEVNRGPLLGPMPPRGRVETGRCGRPARTAAANPVHDFVIKEAVFAVLLRQRVADGRFPLSTSYPHNERWCVMRPHCALRRRGEKTVIDPDRRHGTRT